MWIGNLSFHQVCTKRAERVPALGTYWWTIEVPHEIAYRDIVSNGVATNHSEGITGTNLTASLPNHHGEFDFVMHKLDTSRINDRRSVSNPGVRRFEEQCRLFGGCYLEFRGVVSEVQGHANDRMWHNWWQEYHFLLAVTLPSFVKKDARFGQNPLVI